ncbi:MAG: phosphoethanolamine transferase [Melioribacteraceae bacterium]|nr:phosphoethanolamine transferase [Melioribacteraceae bacterium]
MGIFGKDFRDEYPYKIISSFISKHADYKENFHQSHTQYLNLKYKFEGHIDSPKDVPETIILIIGEAARRSSMSLYGYSRKTTPLLDSLSANNNHNFALFNNCYSASPFTRLSVPSMLSTSNTKDWYTLNTKPDIFRIFKAAGYHISFISNQSNLSFNDVDISVLLKSSDKIVYLRKKKYLHDEKLLPYVFESINSTATKKLIIVHLRGSHYEYTKSYPEEFTHWKGNNLVDAYDNSIRYSDNVIGKITDEIFKSEDNISIIYLSDHGENLNDFCDFNFGHGAKNFTRFELEIPLVFIFNKRFQETKSSKIETMFKYSSCLISHDNLSHTILGLADIYDKNYYNKKYDLCSQYFCVNDIYVMDKKLKIYPLNEIQFQKK